MLKNLSAFSMAMLVSMTILAAGCIPAWAYLGNTNWFWFPYGVSFSMAWISLMPVMNWQYRRNGGRS